MTTRNILDRFIPSSLLGLLGGSNTVAPGIQMYVHCAGGGVGRDMHGWGEVIKEGRDGNSLI